MTDTHQRTARREDRPSIGRFLRSFVVSLGSGWLRLGAIVVALAALFHFVRAEDVARAKALILQVGWPLGLVVLPTFVALAFDATGWRLILRALGHDVPWRRMLRLRLSVEALVLAVPGGSLAGEVAKVGLLGPMGVPPARATASLALTKAFLFTTDGLYLSLAAGWLAAQEGLGIVGGASWPIGAGFGAALVVGAIGAGTFALLERASLAARFAAWLASWRLGHLRRWVEARRQGVADLDEAARSFFATPRRARARCGLAFALEWLVEGAETILIFKLLGAPLSLGQLLVLDALGSFLRAVVFFVPAGLGVQDTATILLLRSFGAVDPIATGAAFMFIKRTKEVFWIVAGLFFATSTKELWRRTNGSTAS